MPEILHPGVYVVEVKGGVRSIEGVPTSTADFVDAALLVRLKALAEIAAPGWTDTNEHDPGVALLSLVAWLSEATLYRMDELPDRAAVSAARIAAVALHALRNRELPDETRVCGVRFYERATVATEASERRANCVLIRRP